MGRERSSAVSACALACALVAAQLLGFAAYAQSDEERELEAIRRDIGELEQRLARQMSLRGEAAAALRQVELDIAAARKAVEQIDAETADARSTAAAVSADRSTTRERVQSERDALAEQVRSTYMNGRAERLKLLLSQENPADLGRMSVYYDYFNRSRVERIRTLAADLGALERLDNDAQRVAAELQALGRARAGELAALDRSRAERKSIIARLDVSIREDGGELERLRAEELRLVELVTELGKVLAAYPVNSEEPFPRLKGRLAWPVQGEVAGSFGKARGAGTNWNGVLLAAPEGTPVRAVYHGRVAFAEWLHGLGLLLVVDHGDGYMSLYGHNAALLKEPGDWVRPGEPIAEVGMTGGRTSSGLYFELRRDGEPVDPAAWMAN